MNQHCFRFLIHLEDGQVEEAFGGGDDVDDVDDEVDDCHD
jgi:hypothetical protein